MKRIFLFILAITVLAGCQHTNEQNPEVPSKPEEKISINDLPEPGDLFFPVKDYIDRLTKKQFKQEVHDRFNGFHVGDDLEVAEEEYEEETPVYSMADGKVVYKNWLSGYGGVLVLQHKINGQILQSLYGHLDLSQTRPGLGESVRAGTQISFLGDHESLETDNERKHLHFGIYPGSTLRLNGYTRRILETDNWINPIEFLLSQKAESPNPEIIFPEDWTRHNIFESNDSFTFSLLLPNDWVISSDIANESVSFSQLNNKDDEALMLLRYFDADAFLTLSTVTIHERYLRAIVALNAIDYDIEKKPWVADFPNQPEWRNQRHLVTDIRQNDGFSRFFAFAQNPDLDKKTIYYILQSIEFLTEE